MAAKANQNRTRIIRSALLSASMLSLVPLASVMQQGSGATSTSDFAMLPEQDVAATSDVVFVSMPASTTQTVESAAEPVATETQTAVATSSTSSSKTAAQTTSYTRTKAS